MFELYTQENMRGFAKWMRPSKRLGFNQTKSLYRDKWGDSTGNLLCLCGTSWHSNSTRVEMQSIRKLVVWGPWGVITRTYFHQQSWVTIPVVTCPRSTLPAFCCWRSVRYVVKSTRSHMANTLDFQNRESERDGTCSFFKCWTMPMNQAYEG